MQRSSLVAAVVIVCVAVSSSALHCKANSKADDSPTPKGAASVTAPTPILPNMPPVVMIKKVEPKYPGVAKAARIEGVVVLTATIDEQGHVTGLQVQSGPEVLAKEAVKAVRQWEYEPYKYKGAVVEVQTTITVTFALPSLHKKEK